jgi:hypothetical protein
MIGSAGIVQALAALSSARISGKPKTVNCRWMEGKPQRLADAATGAPTPSPGTH